MNIDDRDTDNSNTDNRNAGRQRRAVPVKYPRIRQEHPPTVLPPLPFNPSLLPRPADPDQAQRGFERWRERADESGDAEIRDFAAAFAADPSGRAVLASVFGNSPYLTQLLGLAPPLARRLPGAGRDAAFPA